MAHPMIIFVTDPEAADGAVGKVFGDDISKGPVMACPEPLRELLCDTALDTPRWIGLRAREVDLVMLRPAVLVGKVLAHRVQIKCQGDDWGWALRCSDDDVLRLRQWASRL